VRQVHPHGRAFAQNRIRAILCAEAKQLRPNPQRLIHRMAHPEHPLVSFNRAHAVPHLVGERLKSQSVISGGQGARDGITRSLLFLHGQKAIDRFLEPAAQQEFVPMERDERGFAVLRAR